MEMHQVRYFLAVSETRSFTRAAERCHVSQPTLTNAIKKLEEELGGALLLRERQGAKLTALGHLVLPRFQRLIHESESIKNIADGHKRLVRVPLRLGVLATIGPPRMAPYFAELQRRAPGIDLEIDVMNGAALLRKLEDGEIDVLVTNLGGEVLEPCVARTMYEERYVVALPPGHRLADRPELSLGQLAGECYIDRLACELRDRVQAACEKRKIELYPNYRTDREDWVESLVLAGIGFAFLPESSIILGATTQRPLVEPEISRTISIVRWADRALPAPAKLLWDLLKPPAPSKR